MRHAIYEITRQSVITQGLRMWPKQLSTVSVVWTEPFTWRLRKCLSLVSSYLQFVPYLEVSEKSFETKQVAFEV